jgi:hypothetical protein
MSYVFSDQQAKLSSLLGDSNTGSDDQFPLATRKKELNRGELQFAKDSLFLQEYATGTITGTQIAVPSDWLETYSLIINNQVVDNTREVSIQDYERYYTYSGAPPYFYYSQQSGTRYINFFGSTNGLTYKWYYFKKPTTELSSDSDTSLLPDEYREGPVYYAASELMQQIGKQDLSNTFKQKYQLIVRDAQMAVEKLRLNKQYPNPDYNYVGNTTIDIVGGGGSMGY